MNMAKATTKKAPKGKVVEAAMSAGATGGQGMRLDPKAIEDAMGQAVLDALADGVTDNDEILKRKMEARDKVKAEFRAAEARHNAAIQAEAVKKA